MRLDIVGRQPQVTSTPNPRGTGFSMSINFTSETENPSEEQIVAAVRKIYAEEVDAVILLSDVDKNQFIQLPCGGLHIEYCIGPEGPIYSHEDTSIELATQLFLSYAGGDDAWKTVVPWKVEIERL